MSPRQVSIKAWRGFLKSVGLVRIRTKGSHEIWDRPDESLSRPIIFRNTKKEIPLTHIKTNLETLKIKLQDFLNGLNQ
jgi:predicted RNA binding protein YcfA (HicA-like mRNA interferase family)